MQRWQLHVTGATRGGRIRVARVTSKRGARHRQPRDVSSWAYLIRRTFAGVL